MIDIPAKGRQGPPPCSSPFAPAKRAFMRLSDFREGAPSKPAPDPAEAVWKALWASPQAVAWEAQPWRWPMIEELARLTIRCRHGEGAVLHTELRHLRNELGLTLRGLKANGWKIV